MRHTLSDFVTFDNRGLARKWADKKVPMSEVYQAYTDGEIDIPADKWEGFFATRNETVSFTLTGDHWKWAATNLFPEMLHYSAQDHRVVGEHYNRGNDFFEWFLGEAMVYTSAWFKDEDVPLEQAQYDKIDHCCHKLNLQKGESLLDIGCGWGTFVARAAKEFGTRTYGVTLAQEQVSYGMDRIQKYGVADRAKVEVCDYRDIRGKFDKVVSLEMVEHVGMKNLVGYFNKVHSLLEDEGIFVMQWTGIRGLHNPNNPVATLARMNNTEDFIWALFMARYIFPGADASLTLSSMVRGAEDGGFEVTDVEDMSPHYVITLRAWRDNWTANKDAIIAAYGQRWYRLWHFFLHWSALIGEQGSAKCYNLQMHKNHNTFDRRALHFDTKNFR